MPTLAREGLVPETDYVSAAILRSDICGEAPLSVSRTRCDSATPDQALVYGGADAHLARLYLVATPLCDIIQGGRRLALPPRRAMETSFRDVVEPCAWPVAHAIDIISFELPRVAVRRWAEEANHRSFTGLTVESGMSTPDDKIKAIGLALLANLKAPERGSQLFVDSLLDDLCGHLVQRYGGREAQLRGGGLAPWQQRRAKDIIDANLHEEISLRWLAEECGLSVAHFSREFRKSTGQTPYRWMIQRRLERAVAMLTGPNLSLTQIALRCGFADQSHFTHVFTRWVGMSPGAYRRCAKGDERPDDLN